MSKKRAPSYTFWLRYTTIMLQTGRLKDHARIAQFMGLGVVDQERLADILARHGLMKKWESLNLRDPK